MLIILIMADVKVAPNVTNITNNTNNIVNADPIYHTLLPPLDIVYFVKGSANLANY